MIVLRFAVVPVKGRMLPVWSLLPSGILVGLNKYLFGIILKGISTRILRNRYQKHQERTDEKNRDSTANEIELVSNLFSFITCEVLFYPFETVLHRIQLQVSIIY